MFFIYFFNFLGFDGIEQVHINFLTKMEFYAFLNSNKTVYLFTHLIEKYSQFSNQKSYLYYTPMLSQSVLRVGGPELAGQSCKSGRAFRVGFGPGSGPKLTKTSGLIRAWDVLFVLSAQKYNQNNLATLLNFSDLT